MPRTGSLAIAIMETRACADCEALLPGNVPDIFCPACALRRALAVGGALALSSQRGGRTGQWMRLTNWLGRLRIRKQADPSQQIAVASAVDNERRCPPMVAPVQGDVIGDYEILEKIGGNMGLVFRARHRLLEKVVALKLLPADWISDPARMARFQREMRIMGQLEHPNLVTAADARSVDCWHLVAMEWIEGVDLQRLVRTEGPLPVAVSCEAARQAAVGLQYAHQHGLIHRDIKPSNLMLTRTGTIKVIDMGLALTKEDSAMQLTQTGLVLGTVTYCAPEQFRDASRVDIRADIYSLGCTLYHLLTGKAPYCERKAFAEVVQAHLNEPFPTLAAVRPDAPAGLETVLARMTAKDPASRFATPSAVAEALEPFAQGADLAPLVPASVPQSPPPRPAGAKATPAPNQRHSASNEQQPKAHWSRRAALVTLPAAAGAVFLYLNYGKRNRVVLTDGLAVSVGILVVFLVDMVVS